MAYSTSSGAVIHIGVDGADESARRIEAVGASMNRLAGIAKSALTTLATTVGVGGGLAGVIQMSDEYAKVTSQIRLATTSTREYVASYSSVKRIANDAQQDLAATGTLYARITNGTRELGISQQRVADITETVALALRVSGATAEESASAQLQLSQAFAAGALRGEEFNAVNEAAPRLMQALADGIGVPVGALKQMASNGEITSAVMAEVLPQALSKLRDEATQVQTIGGAFTVLKNNVMEFTAVHSQANGTVALLTSGIGFLANNLTLLFGAVQTLTAAKLATWIAGWARETVAKVAADRAATAASLANAQATAASTAASLAQATARTAELRSAVLAAEGNVALQITTNGLVPAQARAAAAAEAHAVALTAQAAAARAASIGGGLASTALGLLGGPIGALVTVLGVAATAWSVYSSSGEHANAATAESTAATTTEVIAQVTKQIEVMERRNRLALAGVPTTATESPLNSKLAEVVAEIDRAGKAEGDYAKLSYEARMDILKKLGGQYGELTALVERFNKASADGSGNTAAAKALFEVRERLLGVNKQYVQDLKALQDGLKDGAVTEKEYVSLVSQLATETWKSSDAGKAATSAAQKSAEAYKNLITTIQEATASNRLELAAGKDATESQKARIKFDEELATGKLKLSAQSIKMIRAALDEQAASERALKSQRSVAEAVSELAQQRNADFASAASEAAANELAAETFGKSRSQIESLTVARLQDRLANAAALELTADDIAQTERLIAVKKRSATALANTDALGYIKQLADENRKFSAEAIFDERSRAAALLDIEADTWRKRIQLAGDGTDAQRQLQEQYTIWYANQLTKTELETNRRYWESVANTAHDTFVSIMDGGKTAATRLKDTFKNAFFDWLYQMTLKKWIINVGASMSGTGAAGVAQAAAGGSNLIGTAGSLSSLYNTATAGVSGSIGSGIATAGNFFGSSQLSAFGAGFADAGGAAMSVADSFAAAGMTVEASAASLGTAISAALPYVAAAVVAYKVLGGMFDDGPESDTRLTFASNNRAGNISINERGNEGKTDAYIGGSTTSSFGTFGVSTSFWAPSDVEQVQNFIKTVGMADDALAKYLTTTEKASVTSYLTSQTSTAHLGAEGQIGSEQATKALAQVFTERMLNILEGVEPGLSKLETGFQGTSAELATEVQSLLAYRSALRDSGEAVFGAKVTLQQIAALKAPTESTSAALQRVTSEFTATNQVAQMLGKDAGTAFGSAGLASEAMRAQIILLSGGMSSFTSQASSFATNYLSDAERLAPVAKQLDAQMSQLGLTTLPHTKAEFKNLVMGLDLSSESGQRLYAGLMNLESAFAQVHATERTAADVLSERIDLQNQLDELTKTSAQLLAKQRNALDASNQALFDQVQAAQKAAALASVNADYQRQIDEVRKSTMSAAEVRAFETKGMDASTIALYDRLAALKAQVSAEAAAAEAIKQARETAAATVRSLGDSLVDSMNKAREAAAAFRSLNDALLTGEMSSLSPELKYAEAKRQFEQADEKNLQAAENAFLAASKAWFGGSAGYAADFAAVLARNSGMAAQKDASADAVPGVWQAILAAMQSSGKAHADGGVGSGWSLVGEKGPELVNFTSPGRVYTASQSREIMAAREQSTSQNTDTLLRALVVEARASNVQRGAAADAQITAIRSLQGEVAAVKRKIARLEAA